MYGGFMYRYIISLILFLSFTAFAEEPSTAQEAEASPKPVNELQLYMGGGLSVNSQHDFDDATGYQFFVGMPLELKDLQDEIKVYAEIGYMDSGSFKDTECFPVNPFINPFGAACLKFKDERKGLWGAGVGEYKFNDQMSGLVRMGLDIGDDDGLIVGFGGKLVFDPSLHGRLEYVIRDETDSIQFNIVFTPGK